MEDIGKIIALIKSLGKGGGGTGGTNDHSKLKNRNKPDQHPIDAITGLKEALNKGGGVGQKGTGENAETFNGIAPDKASGKSSHAEGYNTLASGDSAHSEGYESNAIGRYSHTENLGEYHKFANVTVSNTRVEEKRFDIAIDISKIKLPYVAILYQDSVEKVSMLVKEVKAKGDVSTLVGYTRPTGLTDGTYDLVLSKGIATKEAAHAEGTKTIANARHAHTEGDKTIVTSAVEKDGTPIGTGVAGHAEGTETMVCGENGHAEGFRTIASGEASHAEGYYTTASGRFSHAEGDGATASGEDSHAEGLQTTASGVRSHAEGWETTASGFMSHAEGYETTASGDESHAEGGHTTAFGKNSHVQGKYNIPDTNDGTEKGIPNNKYAHIVGNGTYAAKSNAHTLDWEGNSWYQGRVLVGGTNMDAPDAELTPTSVIIKSSTPGSSKRFEITIDDTGTIKASKVVVEA